MKARLVLAMVALSISIAWAAPCRAETSPEQAIQALVKGNLTKEQVEDARKPIEAAAAREPSNNRWQFGKVLLLLARDDESIAARDLMEQVVEREPRNADYHAWFGIAIFEAIDETGMLSKLRWGLKGKAELEKAVELDPNHLSARTGLVEFYLEAPAIAGGSVDSAEEQANALLAIADGRGEFRGRLALARIASVRKNWREMARQYTLAESAKGDGASPASAMTLHAMTLLGDAADARGALAVAERLVKIAKPEDVTPLFILGEARRQLGDCKAALEQYQKVLARKPEAQNTRFGVASCYEKLGDTAQAATHYEEFARRFPKDPRAGDATQAAKRLRKAG